MNAEDRYYSQDNSSYGERDFEKYDNPRYDERDFERDECDSRRRRARTQEEAPQEAAPKYWQSDWRPKTRYVYNPNLFPKEVEEIEPVQTPEIYTGYTAPIKEEEGTGEIGLIGISVITAILYMAFEVLSMIA